MLIRRSIVLVLVLICTFIFIDRTTSLEVERTRIIDVGGQKIYLEEKGNRGPRVVFESGLGDDSSVWRSIAPKVARFARVILYDRPGTGKSKPRINPDSPVTAREVAATLKEVLLKAGYAPPYILVGHSLGGLYAQVFARQYPRDVSGMVLLDSASPNEPEGVFVSRVQPERGSIEYFEEAGVMESNRQGRDTGPFPDIPLTVITATDHGPDFRHLEYWWRELQRQLAAASPRGKQVIAAGSGHFIQDDRPELTIGAIKRVVLAVGRG